jgi:hypothetical protein
MCAGDFNALAENYQFDKFDLASNFNAGYDRGGH